MRWLAALVLGFALATFATARADAAEPGDRAGPLFHPEGPGRYRWRLGAGTVYDLLPKRVLETARYSVPQLAITARLGLPLGFSVDFRARTLFVAGQGSLGAAWSYRMGRLTLGVQDHQGGAFGKFEETSATATTRAFVNEPGLSAGVAFDDVYLSLTAELIVVFNQRTEAQTGGELTRGGANVGGAALTFVAEKTFGWGLLYAGAGWARTTADYLSWFAYSEARSRFSYLRLMAGYAF